MLESIMRPLKFTRKPVDPKLRLEAITKVKDHILSRITPECLYLFGSATGDKFSDQSDLDFLIVCADNSSLREQQRALGGYQGLTPFSAELVWVTTETFQRKKDLGGVCMIAYEDGELLYGKRL